MELTATSFSPGILCYSPGNPSGWRSAPADPWASEGQVRMSSSSSRNRAGCASTSRQTRTRAQPTSGPPPTSPSGSSTQSEEDGVPDSGQGCTRRSTGSPQSSHPQKRSRRPRPP
eukprot:4495274-Heterocapsa_arctica.AAC.1